VGFLFMHCQEPDYSAHSRAPRRSSLKANSRLAEPRWVAASRAYIAEQASTVEARRKLGKGEGKGDKGKDDA